MAAPMKPCAQVHSEFQPKLTTKSGMADGTSAVRLSYLSRRWRPGRPPAGSQQADLAEQVDRRRPVAELGDRDRVGLQLAERRLRGGDGHAGADRVLIALLVAAGPADD